MNLDPASEIVKSAWKRLERVLGKNELPGEDGASVKCDADDFMLMDIVDMPEIHQSEVALFKNVFTRNYIHVFKSGAYEIPNSGHAFARGFFAHWR